MTTTDHQNENDYQSKLCNVSWIIIANSLLIDTCYARAFPSYNILIGVLAKIVVYQSQSNNSELDVDCQNKSLAISVLSYSFFSTTTVISIIVDIIYCFCWGRQVRT